MQEISLESWITKFGKIYGKRHDRHSTEYMISRLVEEVAELVSPMESRGEIGPGLADVFSWICSLAYKLNLDLADLAWQKYGMNPPKARAKEEFLDLNDYSRPRTLKEWQSFVSDLYKGENASLTPMNALIALMKDVGDLAMLNRKRTPAEQITSKLAAILAWTLTLSQLSRLDLSKVVYDKYDDHCPVCHQETCNTDVCHPLVNMFVSFGKSVNDEDKYALLDTASKYGFHPLVNNVAGIASAKDLSASLDLINKCDAACLVLTNGDVSPGKKNDYRQVFEVLTCFSLLSRGNVWLFARGGSEEFRGYLEGALSQENVTVLDYYDSGHLRALFEANLHDLEEKKKSLLQAQDKS